MNSIYLKKRKNADLHSFHLKLHDFNYYLTWLLIYLHEDAR